MLDRLRHPVFLVVHTFSFFVFGTIVVLHGLAVGHHWKERNR